MPVSVADWEIQEGDASPPTLPSSLPFATSPMPVFSWIYSLWIYKWACLDDWYDLLMFRFFSFLFLTDYIISCRGFLFRPLCYIEPAVKPTLLTLSSDNYLRERDISDGAVINRVFLSQEYKFHQLNMDDESGTLYLKSTRTSNASQDSLLSFAIFGLRPLQFKALFQVWIHDILSSSTTVWHPANVIVACYSQLYVIVESEM